MKKTKAEQTRDDYLRRAKQYLAKGNLLGGFGLTVHAAQAHPLTPRQYRSIQSRYLVALGVPKAEQW